MLLLCSSCAIGGLLLACGDEDTPATPADGGVVRDSQFPSDSRREEPDFDSGPDGAHFCKGRIDTANARCDDFDDGPTDLTARGWTVTSSQDGGAGRFGPRLITDGAAPSSPHALDMIADPLGTPPKPDAGGDGGDGGGGTPPIITDVLPKSILTDIITVDKGRSTLEADVFVAEAPSNSQYRILRFDFGPTPDDLSGLTFDVMADGKWRCVGYGLQALGKELKKGVWQHVKLVMYSTGANLKAYCEVDDIKTGEINGHPTPSTSRRLEIGVTTYATNTPRTRILYDNIDFHAE